MISMDTYKMFVTATFGAGGLLAACERCVKGVCVSRAMFRACLLGILAPGPP
jgi:hypothetical protein